MRKALFSGAFILLTGGIISCSDGESAIPELSVSSKTIIEGNAKVNEGTPWEQVPKPS